MMVQKFNKKSNYSLIAIKNSSLEREFVNVYLIHLKVSNQLFINLPYAHTFKKGNHERGPTTNFAHNPNIVILLDAEYEVVRASLSSPRRNKNNEYFFTMNQ